MKQNKSSRALTHTEVLVTVFDSSLRGHSYGIAERTQKKLVYVPEIYPGLVRMKKQFQYADRCRAQYVVIVGNDGVANQSVKPKIMKQVQKTSSPRRFKHLHIDAQTDRPSLGLTVLLNRPTVNSASCSEPLWSIVSSASIKSDMTPLASDGCRGKSRSWSSAYNSTKSTASRGRAGNTASPSGESTKTSHSASTAGQQPSPHQNRQLELSREFRDADGTPPDYESVG